MPCNYLWLRDLAIKKIDDRKLLVLEKKNTTDDF